jgi:hypothetical protein
MMTNGSINPKAILFKGVKNQGRFKWVKENKNKYNLV